MDLVEVFVLRYDMGKGYGYEGIIGVYSSLEKAKEEMEKQKQIANYRYWIVDYILDE